MTPLNLDHKLQKTLPCFASRGDFYNLASALFALSSNFFSSSLQRESAGPVEVGCEVRRSDGDARNWVAGAARALLRRGGVPLLIPAPGPVHQDRNTEPPTPRLARRKHLQRVEKIENFNIITPYALMY